jgi:alpha-amylase
MPKCLRLRNRSSLSVSIWGMRTVQATALAAVSAVLMAGCFAAPQPNGLSTSNDISGSEPQPRALQVGVQLFMYNWVSVARECEQYLGPAGIDWVLTMPPSEHIVGTAWWTHYQPVSYQIESRLGTRAQYAEMVERCNQAGVEVLADAVINHMSARAAGVGIAGTRFTKYEYPGLYSRDDFHDCGLTQNGQILDYRNREQVQRCELLGLSDLDTGSPRVQSQILSYLNDLLSLGVAGFRIDAAKHIDADELAAIIAQLPAGTRIIHEVIRGGSEPIQPEDYLASGEVWEFDYARGLKNYILNEALAHAASDIRLRFYAPSESAISFITNHDTERNGETLSYRHAQDFELATVMMLAEEYGQPMLYSGYAFDRFDDPPPLDGRLVANVECSGTPASESLSTVLMPQSEYSPGSWVCPHRWPSVIRMIEFRREMGEAATVLRYQREKVYGFAREGRGYFIINVSKRQSAAVSVDTGLPDGSYVNFLDGVEYQIVSGQLNVELAPKTALALVKRR